MLDVEQDVPAFGCADTFGRFEEASEVPARSEKTASFRTVLRRGQVEFMKALCATDGSGGSLQFRLKLLTGKAVTVQFDGKRFTLRAIQQQAAQLAAGRAVTQ